MTTNSGRLFVQTALQLEELKDADASRVLELLPRDQDAGRFAQKLGVLTRSARLRVQQYLGPKKSTRKQKKNTNSASGEKAEAKRESTKSASGDKAQAKRKSTKSASGDKAQAKRKSTKSASGDKAQAKRKSTKSASGDKAQAKRKSTKSAAGDKAQAKRKGTTAHEDRKTPSKGTTPTAERKGRKTPSKGSLPTRQNPTRRQPQPTKSALPLVGLALLLGGGIGVAAVVAFDKPAEPEPQVSQAEPSPVAAPEPPAAEPVDEAPTQVLAKERAARNAVKDAADARAIRTAQATVDKLKARGRERTALTVLDELIAARGPFRAARTARLALLHHCEQVVAQQARRAERLVGAGDLEGALLLLTHLSKRLPDPTQPRIATLVETLKARAAATQPEVIAKAPTTPEAPAPVAKKGPRKTPTTDEDPSDSEEGEAEPEPEPEEGEDEGEPSSAPKKPVKPKAKKAALDTSSPLARAVKERVTVRHTLSADGTLSVNYPLQEAGDLVDFKARGFDTFDVNEMLGTREGATGTKGLECGAGSQRLARMVHSIHFDGDFHIEAELWLSYASGRTLMVFMLGKKHGVSFGQQLVKVSSSGRLKRLSRRPADPTVFREERRVRVQFDYVDGTLTVRCNGRKTAVKRFTKGELKGPFGLIARDVRLQLTTLKIEARVDPTKL